MNQPEVASNNVNTPASAGEIPGIARVETLPPPAKPNILQSTSNTLMGDMVGKLLGAVARILNPELLESSLSGAKKIGHYAVLAGAGLTVAYAIYGAIKFNSFAIFAIGLGCIVALAIAQYAAVRFLGSAENLISATPSRISSSAFVECAGLLALLGAVTVLLSGITSAIVARTYVPLIPALVLALVLTSFGTVALHPRTVNVATGEGTAGEEAIGLISFFFKASLKLVPLFFALLSIAGTLTIAMSFFGDGGALASM